MKRVTFTRDALKVLDRLPANTASLIRSKIGRYARAPESLANNVKTLKGEPGFFRLRVGDWRVIFHEDATVVSVVTIGPRGGVYD